VSPSPERRWDFIYASHPDHLAAGEATVCAVYPDARNPFAHPELLDAEGLEPWTVNELWIVGGVEPNMAVDTTATIGRKVAALVRHESQIADPEGVAVRVRDGGRNSGAAAGLAEGRSAELYRVTRIP
jgi:LmbE family N-acetylglucosaminyl deacetylase